MPYAGLTLKNKPILEAAKRKGAQYAVFSNDGRLVEILMYSPHCEEQGEINIDAALAQIAEMESAEKTNEKCPICEYAISGCQCLYSGSAHPDRHDKERVVIDHLYLLSPTQVQHVISLEKHWQISYADEILNAILKKLIANSPHTEGATK
jgi:tRNA G26 N,N-dimethylase Trm1